jgi:hypothetical protein
MRKGKEGDRVLRGRPISPVLMPYQAMFMAADWARALWVAFILPMLLESSTIHGHSGFLVPLQTITPQGSSMNRSARRYFKLSAANS